MVEGKLLCIMLAKKSLIKRKVQGPRSNFEMGGGGGTISASIWGGGHKTLFLKLILNNFKNIGAGGGQVPPCPPTPQALKYHQKVH